MNLYDKLLKNIEEKKKHKELGNHNMIPFCFPRYKEYFDGFSPGDYIGLLGSTGSGKSRLIRYWMYCMVDFIMKTTYKAKIIYFSLEDPEIPVGLKIMSHYLYVRHNISVSAKMLASKDQALSNKYVELIKNDSIFWRRFDSIVEVVNGLTSPNQIRDKVRKVYKENPDTHIIVLIDNQSNVTADAEDTNEWEAIKRLSRDVIRLGFCAAGITTITVLQLDFDSEKNTFRNVGRTGLVNIEPNLASIGDAKVVARAMHYVFALFDPWRFEIKKYPFEGGYNVEIMRNKFKALLQLKSNEGEVAGRFGLQFDGLHEIFTEMPILKNTEALDKIYTKILTEEKMKKDLRNGEFSWSSS